MISLIKLLILTKDFVGISGASILARKLRIDPISAAIISFVVYECLHMITETL